MNHTSYLLIGYLVGVIGFAFGGLIAVTLIDVVPKLRYWMLRRRYDSLWEKARLAQTEVERESLHRQVDEVRRKMFKISIGR